MIKKGVKKETAEKKIASKPEVKTSEKNMEKILIENFVSLQKVMTNLSIRFDELSSQISKLLNLFEVSAEALAKKDINFGKPIDEKKILERLDHISEQNKTIARGLTLMHERIGGETSAPEMPQQRRAPPAPIAPKRINPPKEEYEKSAFTEGF